MIGIAETVMRLIGVQGCTNFSVVDENLTRSAQLTPEQLDRIINQYGVKTLVSMRGYRHAHKWCRDETAYLAEKGIETLYLGTSVGQYPTKEDFTTIMSVIDGIEYPAHVQCRQGADRTSLFCGLYALAKEHDDPLKQCGIIRHGNVQPYQRRFICDAIRASKGKESPVFPTLELR